MSEDSSLTAHAVEALKIIVPDLWRAVPAAVLALLAFGFRRMAARFLGLFERIEQLDSKVSKHIDDANVSFRLNDQTHASFVAALAEHNARSSESIARVERALEAQSRRIDEIVRK